MTRLASQSSGDLSDLSSISSTSRPSTTGLSVADLLQSPTEKSLPPPPPRAVSKSNAKVPIPRQRTSAAPRHSRRVPRACESCRLRKTKCSGDTPVCKLCQDSKTACVYPLAIREKTNRTISCLSRRLNEYEELLREVQIIVPKRMARRIQALLDKEKDFNLSERSYGEEPSQEDVTGGSCFSSLEIVENVNEDIQTTDISWDDGVRDQMLKYNLDSSSIGMNQVSRPDPKDSFRFSSPPKQPFTQ